MISPNLILPSILYRSILENTNPPWIGPSQKQGVCHILVNEGKINWVIGDE